MKARCSHGAATLGYRHNCLVVTRRRIQELWGMTYWVICIYCDQMQGPHREKADAWQAANGFNHLDALPAWPECP